MADAIRKYCCICGMPFLTNNRKRAICYKRRCRMNRNKNYAMDRAIRIRLSIFSDKCPYESHSITFEGIDGMDPRITPLENHDLPVAIRFNADN